MSKLKKNGDVWGNGMPKGEISLGAPRCLVCRRVNVDEINREIAQGLPIPMLCIRHKVSQRSMYRHKEEHVLTSKYSQGLLAVTIKDVMDIPMDMTERRAVQHEIVAELLAPMTRPGPGVNMVNWQFLLGVWKLMMQDESVMMRVVGVLPEGGAGGEQSIAEQAPEMRARIDTMLHAMIEKGGMPAEQARAAMSQFLSPTPELPMGRAGQGQVIDAEWSAFTDDDGEGQP